MATFSTRTASPPPPSRTPAGSRASSRHASIVRRTTSARGPRAWAAPRTTASTTKKGTGVGGQPPPSFHALVASPKGQGGSAEVPATVPPQRYNGSPQLAPVAPAAITRQLAADILEAEPGSHARRSPPALACLHVACVRCHRTRLRMLSKRRPAGRREDRLFR